MQALRQPNYLGVSNAFQSIIKSEGILGLYSGLSAVLVGAIPSHALSFMTYEFMKKKLTLDDEDHHRPSNFTAAISGASATIVHDFVSTPLDVIKQSNSFFNFKEKGMQVYDSPFKNLFSCIKSTYQQGGMKIFFVSYPVTVLMNIPYASVHFMAYGRLFIF
jgi:solute carrier family 25 (mitochondrial iron transporter), member 28/37